MVITSFQVLNKLDRACFFQKSFLLADISMKMVYEILFVTFTNVNIWFVDKKITWKTYITKETMTTI